MHLHGILLATCCEVNAQNINLLSRATVMLMSIFIVGYHILLHGNVSLHNFVSMQVTVPLGKFCLSTIHAFICTSQTFLHTVLPSCYLLWMPRRI